MLGGGFRRGARLSANIGRTMLSQRTVMQHRRAMAMGVCIAHNNSLTGIGGASNFVAYGELFLIVNVLSVIQQLYNIFLENFQVFNHYFQVKIHLL